MTNRTPTLRIGEPRGVSDHLPDLRSALEQQRQFRADQLDELAAELADPATAADLPRIHVAAAVRTAAAAALADIDAALQRIEHGGYGTCQQCDTAIPSDRLEILPMSRLCMRCQHAAETRRPATTHQAVQDGGNKANPARHPQPPLWVRRRERGVYPANRRATTNTHALSRTRRVEPSNPPNTTP